MIVTISTAKLKECPLTMSASPQTQKCLVDACMAWRFVESDKGFCGASGYPIELNGIHKLFQGRDEDAANGEG